MKSSVVNFVRRYAIMVIVQIIFACDSLEKGDEIRPTLAQSEYYTLPRSSVIIDLTSLANQSYTNASISISGNPSKGELTQVDALLFKYKPAADFTNGEDQFDVSVKSDGNIVSTQRIKIHAKASKEQFPCALITLEDKVETKPGSTISIAVLDNDWFCGVDKSSLTLSIHSNPLYGQTVVDGESINYIPGFDYGGQDEFIYRLTSSTDESICYGIVSIVDPPSIYIAGSGYNMIRERYIAQVWGNGKLQVTEGEIGSIANSIYVSGDDVFMAGYEYYFDFYPDKAMIWKNGVAQPLTNGNNEAGAFSIFVSNDDVYVAGYDSSFAMLWKNGVPIRLSDGAVPTQATSVFVSNGDVYVVGNEFPTDLNRAILWKNGMSQPLNGGSYATSVFVSGNDVYVAGGNGSRGMVWKNGVAQSFFNKSYNSYALSVHVEGEDVYVAGYEQPLIEIFEFFGGQGYDYAPTKALVWKNGVPQRLTNGNQGARANFISVFRDDVYVAGYDGELAVIWKNGIAKSIDRGIATALFIK